MEEVILKSETLGRKTGPRSADLEAFKKLGPGITMAEVGVYRGEHAEAMLELLKPCLFVVVDYWDYIKGDIFQHPGANPDIMPTHDVYYLESWYRLHGRREVLMLKGLSEDIAKLLKVKFDYVYVDGGHLEEVVARDVEVWYPLVNPGGIFAGHDYDTVSGPGNLCGVKRVVDKVFGSSVKHSEGATADWWVHV